MAASHGYVSAQDACAPVASEISDDGPRKTPKVEDVQASQSNQGCISSDMDTDNCASGTTKAEEVQLMIRWGAQSLPVLLSPADWETLTLGELKQRLDEELDIPKDKMKVMGVTGSKGQPEEAESLRSLNFKKSYTIMLVGTARQYHLKEARPEPPPEPGTVIRNEIHLQRLAAAIQCTQIQMITPPREGKRLLVIDLDYTVFDCKSSAPIEQCKRPFTDEMLVQVYPFYDLVVWSQTKWHWVEAKLTELGMLTHSQFSISWCMDRSSMFTVTSTDKRGEPRVHEVKALEVIWAKFSEFGPHNTVHIDDLSRNFAMNPQNGIEVTPFRVKHGPGDVELEHLTAYLLSLVSAPDLSQVDHSKWRSNFS
jgi:ubiquitin-like domain-containing CTD phosphatase 1